MTFVEGGIMYEDAWRKLCIWSSGVCVSYMYSKVWPTRCNIIQFFYFCKLLYMFRVDPSPIIRSITLYL